MILLFLYKTQEVSNGIRILATPQMTIEVKGQDQNQNQNKVQ